jgi:4'-phosphopantetheinyl transferase EntD
VIAVALAVDTRWEAPYSPGIDLEYISRRISDPAWEHMLCPEEEQFFRESVRPCGEGEGAPIAPLADVSPATRMILFSSKESLYKALYPACGIYFGFQDACVTQESAGLLKSFDPRNGAGPREGWLELSLRRNLGDPQARFTEGSVFSCHYEIDGGYLLCAVMGNF